MTEVTRWKCDICQREHVSRKDAEFCEANCKGGGEKAAKVRRDILAKETALRNKGMDVWWEDGEMKHSPKINPDIFGPHHYPNKNGTSDCSYGCDCWMGRYRSGGPVNPFGACPSNPK